MSLFVDISKSLPNFDLKVSFSCKKNELLVLIGPSGAGKTTIIRIIAGLEKPDKGKITFNGLTLVDTKKKIWTIPQRRNLGFVFQDYTLFPHLTVFKNVSFAAVIKEDVERLLKLFDIWHLRDSMPSQLSGGERQRCAICQNLAKKPSLLLLDEPFSALDVSIRRKLRQGLKLLKELESLTMIHVTHDLKEAVYLGDNILPIVDGSISFEWMEQQLHEAKQEEILSPVCYTSTFNKSVLP